MIKTTMAGFVIRVVSTEGLDLMLFQLLPLPTKDYINETFEQTVNTIWYFLIGQKSYPLGEKSYPLGEKGSPLGQKGKGNGKCV
jgi:hypothetical protein